MTTQSASLPNSPESPETQPPTQAARPGLPSAFGQPLPVDCGLEDDESDLHDVGQRMVDDLQAFLANALSTTKTKPV